MKKKMSIIIAGILFLAGLSLLLYPLVANQWNTYRQSRLISEYETTVSTENSEGAIDYEKEWEKANAYNASLLPSILPDSFAIAAASDEPGDEYMSCLNILNDGMMGYVEVPKINIKIPIFHTTSEEVLNKGAGHLEGSSLPVGGENTHAVISAHRGLPSASLFTDLDQLEKGDHFLISVLDQKLCYEVDQIRTVEPEDTGDLAVEPGEDLVTLLTCTPYGVNTQRLLVRGHRVPYEEEVVEKEEKESPMSLYTNYLLWVVIGLAVTAVLIFGLWKYDKHYKRKRKRKTGTGFRTERGIKMKRKLSGILFGLLFLTGFGILVYPTVSNQWNTYRQSRLISDYEKVVSDMKPEDYTEEWEAAREFDSTLVQNNIYGDVFDSDDTQIEDTDYWKVLNVAEDGVMGYLSIPKINVRLAIYHGTAEDVLQTGIGHMNGTSLPIGGESTHSVLAAHRGLPAARLFTDIDQMQQGDMFYIHVLDETLAYQVDQILDMVEKDDHETLEDALQIQEGKDQVTLFTCTPYGVNSHRLLVRGTRVPYNGEEETENTPVDSMLRAIQNYYMLYLILGLAVTLLVILIMKFLFDRKNKKHSGKTDDMSKEG